MKSLQSNINISGDWRLENGSPVFRVHTNPQNQDEFTFSRTDGEGRSFHGHGVIRGAVIVVSWRSTLRFGHGSDESHEIKFDPISERPIEIHWKGGSPTWMTVSN